MYKIVRFYSRMPSDPRAHLITKRRTIKSRLTLEQAQAHCSDPETSSSTCSRVKHRGWDWFDGYTET